MPQGPYGIVTAGCQSINYSTNQAGAQVKSAPGTFVGLTVNTAGATSTATVYDGTSASGKLIATVNTTAINSLTFNAAITTGLFVVLAGGTAANVTILYR